MGIKKDIVIVNEYTIKNNSGHGGSRGGSPGDYVLRYMARDDAIEQCVPVRLHDMDNYITRYMARETATESLKTTDEIHSKLRDMDGIGGVAFGYGSSSLSHEKVLEASKDIQKNFDAGKTVMKTVISFDQEYLKRMGLVDEDFEIKKRGDYKGNVDQMKLRLAIMNGLEKMSKNYNDLQYVGVIQVDTKNVHCHLAMVDRGRGELTEDGTQKGKISEKNKNLLRRNIDLYLDEKQPVKMMASDITQDRRNIKCFVKKRCYQALNEYGIPQILLATLPENKNLWRASSKAKIMQRPNKIVRSYVQEILKQPNSGYKNVLQNIDKYAEYRRAREELSQQQMKKLIENGKKRVIDECINSVYAVLKQIPEKELSVETYFLKTVSSDLHSNALHAREDKTACFSYKLRSYSNRLEYHKKEMQKYRALAETYEKSEDKSNDSIVLYQFFKYEEEYNEKLMSKYQHFLSFLPPEDEYKKEFKELMEYKKKLNSMYNMMNDNTIARMKAENAEEYGKKVYDMHGGRYMVLFPSVLKRRFEQMQSTYGNMEKKFKNRLSEYGMQMQNEEIILQPKYDFNDVKALDIHHLGYDFYQDVPISENNAKKFIDQSKQRYTAFVKAKEYLEKSGQGYTIFQLPEKDIKIMNAIAQSLAEKKVLEAQNVEKSEYTPRSKTVQIQEHYAKELELTIRSTIQTLQLEDEIEF